MPEVDHEPELAYATSPLQHQPWKLCHHRSSFTPAVVRATRSSRHCTYGSNKDRGANPNSRERTLPRGSLSMDTEMVK